MKARLEVLSHAAATAIYAAIALILVASVSSTVHLIAGGVNIGARKLSCIFILIAIFAGLDIAARGIWNRVRFEFALRKAIAVRLEQGPIRAPEDYGPFAGVLRTCQFLFMICFFGFTGLIVSLAKTSLAGEEIAKMIRLTRIIGNVALVTAIICGVAAVFLLGILAKHYLRLWVWRKQNPRTEINVDVTVPVGNGANCCFTTVPLRGEIGRFSYTRWQSPYWWCSI